MSMTPKEINTEIALFLSSHQRLINGYPLFVHNGATSRLFAVAIFTTNLH
ncbi:hypothetical protein [Paenibacillus albiflavus]|nr:hypothetical protein [Paenibacillus albiflavus]